MTLPPFASLSDLDARRVGGVSDRESARAWAAIIDASALIRSVANGKTWATDAGDTLVDVPDILVAITCAAARRALDNPDGVTSESLGQYSVSLANSSGDVYLTTAEQGQVRKAAGLTGMFVIATTRDSRNLGLDTANVTCGAGGTYYVETDPPGDPLAQSDDLEQ